MNTSAPRFSIVMPAYNAEATIEDAIASVLAQEGDASWELIITDDGSTDDTRIIIERTAASDPRISVASQPNVGAGAALTAAIRRATGEFVVHLDADDELLPQYCSATAAFIAEHPGFDIYAADAYRVFPDGQRVRYHESGRFNRIYSATVDDMLDACQIFVTAAFRREWFDRVGGFSAEHYNEDYDFWLRAMIAGARHVYQPVPLTLYRVSASQKTADEARVREADIAVLRSAINSGGLTSEQAAHAERSIVRLTRNIAFRRWVARLVGARAADPVFRLAHRVAVALRDGEEIRFLVVGAWNTLFGLGVLWLLDRFVPYPHDSLIHKQRILTLAWIIAVTQNFIAFKLLVFRTVGNWLREYGRAYVMYAGVFVIQSALTLAISQLLKLSLFWANVPTVLAITVLSYLGHKYFTFRRPKHRGSYHEESV